MAWTKAGPGRPKGKPNKTPTEIKDMILQALDHKGGWRYLARQADANPVAFLGLLGKIMPLQVNGSGNVLLIEQLCVVANNEWQKERARLSPATIDGDAVEVTPIAPGGQPEWNTSSGDAGGQHSVKQSLKAQNGSLSVSGTQRAADDTTRKDTATKAGAGKRPKEVDRKRRKRKPSLSSETREELLARMARMRAARKPRPAKLGGNQ